jgi:AraC family transcriptional regulator, arabinose operon regulatory protein
MDQRIRDMISMLSSDVAFELSLTDTAAHVNLSVSRFRHLFKYETGMSVVQYVKTMRLKKAKELLESTPLSIKQIMAEVGIKDKSNFCRDFKKTYGLSPVKYRKDFQSKDDKATVELAAIFTNK